MAKRNLARFRFRMAWHTSALCGACAGMLGERGLGLVFLFFLVAKISIPWPWPWGWRPVTWNMNKVYLTQGPKVWLSKSVYMKRVNKQKNTKCDSKKVRKSVCRQTVHRGVDVYIGWKKKKKHKLCWTDTWHKTDEHKHKRQIIPSRQHGPEGQLRRKSRKHDNLQKAKLRRKGRCENAARVEMATSSSTNKHRHTSLWIKFSLIVHGVRGTQRFGIPFERSPDYGK